MNAIKIILKGRQGTLESSNLYSKSSVLSFKDEILILRKYRRSVLFPKIVVSAFTGFVL